MVSQLRNTFHGNMTQCLGLVVQNLDESWDPIFAINLINEDRLTGWQKDFKYKHELEKHIFFESSVGKGKVKQANQILDQLRHKNKAHKHILIEFQEC